jgi:hypothetical protein
VPVSAERARDSAATGTSSDASVETASDNGSADIVTISSVSAETTASVGPAGSVSTNLTDTAASPERVTIAVNM